MSTFLRFLSLASLYALALVAVHAESAVAEAHEAPPTPVPPGFALVPAGEFMMGDALDGIRNAPQHRVNVSAFSMQKYLVTNAQWDEVLDSALKHGYNDLKKAGGKAAQHPVVGISWYAAVKWCNARSERDGLVPCYYTDIDLKQVYRTGENELSNAMVRWDANGYRLPTEAEWEKAGRGGLIGKRLPWGDIISHNQANFCNLRQEGYQTGSAGYHPAYKRGTSPVGSFAANAYGLYDMAGNVNEWCWDRLGLYPEVLETDPRGLDSGMGRVRRGGCWADSESGYRVARRLGQGAGFFIQVDGLRPVRRTIL
ncbi:MAG: SUMF1/EgtB/PvdO family nonheme iron enzyme [Verrucomicrobiota bacterium]